MNNIVLVGAGQIGSRHLQALSNIKNECRITVFDPNQSALERAQNRLLDVSDNALNVFFTTEMPVDDSFSLAIIATSADVRLAVFEALVQQNKLKYIIFEKVLFQSVLQIQQCTKLLETHAIRAWVNCPRRAFTSYKKLKSVIEEEQFASMKVTGSSYGLACNGIHFVDLFVFLNGLNNLNMKSELGCDVIESKRGGCFEVFGKLHITANDHSLSLFCDNVTDSQRYEIEIRTTQTRFVIDELAQKMRVYNNEDTLLSTTEFVVTPQSQLSHIVATEIMTKGRCDLTTFSESALLHEQYLSVFIAHFNAIQPNRFKVCPIS
ncbi:Gfo/Idh/MocA family oxidoreductase [uncultured Paraglaciecola sp.]|uniref:Gfo/Idh/MocA family oxidoreductase n=1 Tax=uncultured Paraglaciecola sp. TaxID=1765024 RepID=UPI0026251AC2|nr:Gfo/Idh/MocA family oxidoreductase [uncultured Paraglaciecola sp.]